MSAFPNILSFIDHSRAIVAVRGADAAKLLQGLISNDINKASADSWLYSLMLTAQGKISLDLFIKKIADGYLLDCPIAQASSLINKVNFYKLRSDVVSGLAENFKIMMATAESPEGSRLNQVWRRHLVCEPIDEDDVASKQYHVMRMSLLVPDFTMDLFADKFFPHELGLNNAIDYGKGCYIGQEVTARVEYRGQVRKKIYAVKVQSDQPTVKGEDVIRHGLKVGIVLGRLHGHALCLLKGGNVDGLHTNLGVAIECI